MSYISTKMHEATIAAQGSLSAAIDCEGGDIVRLHMSAAWTAADLTFQVDDGDGTFRDIYWDWGAELVMAAAAGIVIELSPFILMHAIELIKVRSGTAAVPVAQNAERIIQLAVSARN